MDKDQWLLRAHEAGRKARSRSSKGPARERFELWWETKTGQGMYGLRLAMGAAFVRGWLEEDAKGDPDMQRAATQRGIKERQFSTLCGSAEAYAEFHFDAEKDPQDAWRAWSEIMAFDARKARKMRKTFLAIWGARISAIEEAHDDEEREADRAKRAAQAAQDAEERI